MMAAMAGSPRRIHITGGPGSGKTWLATRLSERLVVPRFDQDGVALATLARLNVPVTTSTPPPEVIATMAKAAGEFASGPCWVSEASSLSWASPLLLGADVVVWLDTPAHIALRRVFMRHVRAELGRDNRFPGWRRMYRFWRWSRRFYADRNPAGLNPYGTPMTRSTLLAAMDEYSGKLIVCSKQADVKRLDRVLGACTRA
jgi:hypothetical protein